MKYCLKCGCPCEDNDNFCTKCGYHFIEQNEINNIEKKNDTYSAGPVISFTFSLVSVVVAIIGSLFAAPLMLISLAFAIAGLILGIKSRKKPLGLSGLIISAISIGLQIIVLIAALITVLFLYTCFLLI